MAPCRVLQGCLVCGALSDKSDRSDKSDESLVATLMRNLGIVEGGLARVSLKIAIFVAGRG